MEGNPNVRPTPQLILGLLVIVAGVLFTLDNLSILQARDYFRFWPLALMALGTAKFFEANRPSSVLAGALFFGIGSLLLLHNLHVLRFHFGDLWPVILVIIGGGMLWQAVMRDRVAHAEGDSTISAFAILGGVERTCSTQDFRGGDLTAIMGGCEIDLRQASIQADQAVLNTFAFWGGIEIKVPEDWIVVAQGIPILGGFEERTRPPKEGVRKKLLIKGLVIMGGVEVRN